jgi:osmoprotectant transport system substrate-binding protein
LKHLRPAVAMSLIGALALSACGSDDEASSATTSLNRPTINVGHTVEPASELLAEIYGQGLENAGYRIGRKDAVADRSATLAALNDDRAQLVPEVTASLLAHLAADAGTEATAGTIDEQLTALGEALPTNLAPGPATGADAVVVVACSQAAMAEHSPTSITDLAAVAADVTLGGVAAFETAESFGLAALNAAYEVEFTFVAVGDDEAAAALADGTIDCLVAPQTTAVITIEGLIALDDDKTVFPADLAMPLLTLNAATPDVVAVLTEINATLTTEVLRALLVKVAVSDQPYDVIAKQFLASQSTGQ